MNMYHLVTTCIMFAECILIVDIFTEPEVQLTPDAAPPGGEDKGESTPWGSRVIWPPKSETCRRRDNLFNQVLNCTLVGMSKYSRLLI